MAQDRGPRVERWTAWAGLAFVVIFVVLLTQGAEIDRSASAQQLAAAYADRAASFLADAVGASLYGLCLLAFATGLSSALGETEFDGSGLPRLALASVALFAGLLLCQSASEAAAVAVARSGGEPAAVQALAAVDHALGQFAGLPLGLFAGAASLGGLRRCLLPRGLSWVGVGSAVCLLLSTGSVVSEPVGVLAFVGGMLLLVWVAVASIVLLRRRATGLRRAPAAA